MNKRIFALLIILCLLIPITSCNKYGVKQTQTELVFPTTVASEINLNVGDTLIDNYVMFKGIIDFSASDIVIMSSKPEVATAEITKKEFPIYFYFDIQAHSIGETLVYATTNDGSVTSDIIRVTVSEPETIPETAPQINESEIVTETSNQPESIPQAEMPEATIETQTDAQSANPTEPNATYILNTDSKKFHIPSCTFVGRMNEENKAKFDGSRDELIANGYSSCKTCKS